VDTLGISKNVSHPETFSVIFDGLEFKWAFKKPQIVEDFGHSLHQRKSRAKWFPSVLIGNRELSIQ
jgi:hypothetical protein